VPDLTRLPEAELLAHLGSDSQWASHTGWQQIIDRNAVALAPNLERVVRDPNKAAPARLQALWALEGSGAVVVIVSSVLDILVKQFDLIPLLA